MAFATNNSYFSSDVILVGKGSHDKTTTPTYVKKIKPSDGVPADGNAYDVFGSSVAVGANRIVVGAHGNDSGAANNVGAAYIFAYDGTMIKKIKASDGAADDLFGYSLAIGSNRIVVGAYNDADNGTTSGSAYIFDMNGNQLAKIKPSDGAAFDYFSNYQIGIGSGRIVIGSFGDDDNGSNSGSAYIFDMSGRQIAKIKPADGAAGDQFGRGISVGSNRIVVGSIYDDVNGAYSGSAYIFDLNGKQLAKIKASDGAADDYFGERIAAGCGRIVVTASGDDDNGYGSGSLYLFDMNGNQLAKIKPSGGVAYDNLGTVLAIGDNRIVASAIANNAGAVYVFDIDGNELVKVTAPDAANGDYFSTGIGINDGILVVGANHDNDNGTWSGSAYLYTTPKQRHFLDIFDKY